MAGNYVESSYKNFRAFFEDGVPFRTGADWLRAKRQVDNVGGLWRIHDKCYDLTTFVDKHPGGRDWIELTKGTDITEAFETSHVINVDKVESTLAKYYVKDVEEGHERNSPYTFKEGGFYKTLKTRVLPILEDIGTGPSLSFNRLQDSLVAMYVLVAILGAYHSSTPLQLIGGLLLGMSVSGAHNYVHMKDKGNWRRFYFDLSPFTSLEFRICHILSHHLFTNTIMDYELDAMATFLDTLPGRRRGWIKGIGSYLYSHLFYTLFMTLSFLSWMRLVLSYKQAFRMENTIMLAQLFVIIWISPDLMSGLKSQVLMHMVASYWIGLLSNVHHHPSCFHDGDDPLVETDFGLRQLDSNLERTDSFHSTLFFVLTTFGEHPLHHLFPTICLSKLHLLKPALDKTLEEFKTPTRCAGQIDIILGTHKQYLRETRLSCKERRSLLS